MKTDAVDTPELIDGVVKEATGKTLKAWFAWIDGQGGLEPGRRELVSKVFEEGKLDEWWAVTLVIEYEKARGQKEKDGKPKGYSICSTKTIAAPLAAVYGAFGDAQTLDRWLGAVTKVAFEEGGELANADGDRATFGRLRANKDIRMTWRGVLAPDTAVEVLFADKGKGKTGVTLNHTRIQTRRDADLVRAGWSAAFDALKSTLEKA